MTLQIELPKELFEARATEESGHSRQRPLSRVELKCGCRLFVSWIINAEGKLWDIALTAWMYPTKVDLTMYWGSEIVASHHHTQDAENLLFQDVKAELIRQYQIRNGELRDGPSTPNPAEAIQRLAHARGCRQLHPSRPLG